MFGLGFFVGAIVGGLTAWRRKGDWRDILQYMAGYGIAFGLLVFVAWIIYARMNTG